MTMGHAGGLSSAGLGAVGWSGRGLVPRNWGHGGENNRGSDVYCKVSIYIYTYKIILYCKSILKIVYIYIYTHIYIYTYIFIYFNII